MSNQNNDRKEQLKTVKAQIIANSTDARMAKNLISDLLSLQRQEDVVPMELQIPLSEVLDTADADSFKVTKTTRGYLFQTRGGALSTFVELKYNTVCSMLDTLMTLMKKEEREDYEQYYQDCISYVMQSPIFASMGLSLPAYGKPAEHDSLFNIGIAILKEFGRFSEKHFTDAEPRNETEDDIKANDEQDAVVDAVENLINNTDTQS